MRYLIILIFSCTLLFSCGSESKPAPANTKITTKGKKAKTVKAANTSINTKYWKFVKNKVGLTNPQIKRIQKINKKYAPKITALKKDKRWKGQAKRTLLDKKEKELKAVIGNPSWRKWEVANTNWVKNN